MDSYSNSILNPVVLSFDAGTYTLQPIGVADGGAYNAYSLHDAWPNTWVWWYMLSSTELGEVAVSADPPTPPGGGYYATEMDAFAAATSYTFTLTHADNVNFWIHDGPNGWEYCPDNVGGVSLSFDNNPAPVPEPATVLLFGAGIAGLVDSRLRRKK